MREGAAVDVVGGVRDGVGKGEGDIAGIRDGADVEEGMAVGAWNGVLVGAIFRRCPACGKILGFRMVQRE